MAVFTLIVDVLLYTLLSISRGLSLVTPLLWASSDVTDTPGLSGAEPRIGQEKFRHRQAILHHNSSKSSESQSSPSSVSTVTDELAGAGAVLLLTTATSVVGVGDGGSDTDEEEATAPPSLDPPFEPAFEASPTTWAPAFCPSCPVESVCFPIHTPLKLQFPLPLDSLAESDDPMRDFEEVSVFKLDDASLPDSDDECPVEPDDDLMLDKDEESSIEIEEDELDPLDEPSKLPSPDP